MESVFCTLESQGTRVEDNGWHITRTGVVYVDVHAIHRRIRLFIRTMHLNIITASLYLFLFLFKKATSPNGGGCSRKAR